MFHHLTIIILFVYWESRKNSRLKNNRLLLEAREISKTLRTWCVLSIRTERKNWFQTERKKEIFIFFAVVTLFCWWTVGLIWLTTNSCIFLAFCQFVFHRIVSNYYMLFMVVYYLCGFFCWNNGVALTTKRGGLLKKMWKRV